VLGMCNAVINWRPSDQGKDTGRIAAQFAKLIANGLAASGGEAGWRGRRNA
jgi:hypothetical protein